MYDFRPYVRNCNISVALIATFLLCSSGGAGINTVYSDAELSTGVKDFRTLLTMISALALSLFVIKGLFDTNKHSLESHGEIKKLALEADRLERLDKEEGTLSSTLFLGYLGMSLSGLACAVNITVAGTTFKFIQSSDNKYITPGWLLTVLIITNLASLVGFVLLNILGARNIKVLAAKHTFELEIKDEKIRALEDEKLQTGQAGSSEGDTADARLINLADTVLPGPVSTAENAAGTGVQGGAPSPVGGSTAFLEQGSSVLATSGAKTLTSSDIG